MAIEINGMAHVILTASHRVSRLRRSDATISIVTYFPRRETTE